MFNHYYEYLHTNLISLWEYVALLPYLMIIYAFAYLIRNYFYKKSPLKKYFIPGLTVKIIGAIAVTLIYNFYYNGGDTCVYYAYGKLLCDVIIEDPIIGFRLLLSKGGTFPLDLIPYVQKMQYVHIPSSFMVVKIAAFFQLFTFQSFLITSVLFAFVSFLAIWKIFTIFCEYYPTLNKQFAIAFLFIPSVFFWGSGIMKDTVCLAALAILFSCIDRFFLKGKNRILNGAGIFIAAYILTLVKVYIIVSFSACALLLISLHYRNKIKNANTRIFITPIILFLSILFSTFVITIINENSITDSYSINNLLVTSEITRQYIYSIGGGSTYSLGEIENSIWGLIKVFPAGINVTLFRPYIWEAHNFISILAALESFAILILTLSVIFKTGFFNFFRLLLSKNIIVFCITFSFVFAFAVGISSYNFGSLVRYKIPCIPFYIAAIHMIGFLGEQEKIKKKERRIQELAY